MSEQSVARIRTITIGDHTYRFLMGFRAHKELGLNPYKPGSLSDYLRDMDGESFQRLINAGIMNANRVLKIDDPARPTEDEIIDWFDDISFNDALTELFGVKKTAEELAASAAEKPADPPPAQTG